MRILLRYILITGIVFNIPSMLYAQQVLPEDVQYKPDSLFAVCKQYFRTDIDCGIDIASQILTIGKEQKNHFIVAKSNYYLGSAQLDLANYTISRKHLETALFLFRQLGDKEFESLALARIAAVYDDLNEEDKALAYNTEALAIAKECNYRRIVIGVTNNIAILFNNQKLYDNAIAYYEEALLMQPAEKERALLLLNIGKSYESKRLYDKALTYYKKSLSVCHQIDFPACLVSALNGMASIHWEQHKFEKVIKISQAIIEFHKKRRLPLPLSETYSRIGTSYLNLNKSHLAIPYLKKALLLAIEIQSSETHLMHANLAVMYRNLGKFKLAYEHLSKQKELYDSLEKIKKEKQLDELLTKYESNKKEQQIALLNQEKKVQQFELYKKQTALERQALIRNGIIIMSSLLLIPAIILLILYRQKIKNRMILAEKTEEINQQKILELIREHEIKTFTATLDGREKERERIAHELHDGIAGSLAGIKLQLTKVAEQHYALRGLEKIIKNIDSIYEEVRTISHNLSPLNVLNQSFIDLLRSQLNQLTESCAFELTFVCYPEDELNGLPDSIKIEVYRIIQELLTNIIKHAEAISVEVQFTKRKESISLIVEDIGKGFDTSTIAYGLGLTSIRKRVYTIAGKIHIDSVKGRGTIINIDIPAHESNPYPSRKISTNINSYIAS
jgi:signal transduction histidine kinase